MFHGLYLLVLSETEILSTCAPTEGDTSSFSPHRRPGATSS